MTLGCLAAGCSLVGSPSVMAQLVLTGCAVWGY